MSLSSQPGTANKLMRLRLYSAAEVADKLRPVWGLDQEGELNSVWKNSGHEGLWIGIRESGHVSFLQWDTCIANQSQP
ncbi:hypothetical protein LshimejAT787_0407190 [Lyophyllum shimeji]|uniref:Uncharacterized protein n=1 Tax=Lyophyllum shimeji TaxID=47721 RepID=A0A9P3PLK1_LYOSH|nr:hypothetical protein LshimejAT787_0407190 [Lyophyllum shimeji]